MIAFAAVIAAFSIVSGSEWVPIENLKDVQPGSALDFQSVVRQGGIAGAHGWTKAVGDHFEFEALPGTPQRFYGVNLCMSAAFPETADEAERSGSRRAWRGWGTTRYACTTTTISGAWVRLNRRRWIGLSPRRYGMGCT